MVDLSIAIFVSLPEGSPMNPRDFPPRIFHQGFSQGGLHGFWAAAQFRDTCSPPALIQQPNGAVKTMEMEFSHDAGLA
jgi:hypothetical protein